MVGWVLKGFYYLKSFFCGGFPWLLCNLQTENWPNILVKEFAVVVFLFSLHFNSPPHCYFFYCIHSSSIENGSKLLCVCDTFEMFRRYYTIHNVLYAMIANRYLYLKFCAEKKRKFECVIQMCICTLVRPELLSAKFYQDRFCYCCCFCVPRRYVCVAKPSIKSKEKMSSELLERGKVF